jgi:hypothetical protein
MRRRGWFLLQLGCGVILLLSIPSTIGGLVEDLRGPYEVHAGSAEANAPAVAATDPRAASRGDLSSP